MGLAACSKGRPPIVVPSQAHAPDVTPPAIPAVPEIVTSRSDSKPATDNTTDATKVADVKPPRPSHRFHRRNPPPVTPTPTPPPPAVAENRPSSEGLITTMGSRNDDVSRASTERLLDQTERNLADIRRGLNDDEKGMRQQILSYTAEARNALKSDDLIRAHNLASKAQSLSAALARPK